MAKYRCKVQSPEAVVQLIAASYLRHGYYWYTTGVVPENKNPDLIQQKLIQKYKLDVSEWERSRRRKNGLANAQLICFGRWFILMVTEGHHPIRQSTNNGGEGDTLKDCRRVPIRFHGYSISYRRRGVNRRADCRSTWTAHVRIDAKNYAALKAHFELLAVHRTSEHLEQELRKIPFARYAPIRRQLLCILRRVNRARSQHGLSKLPCNSLSLRRQPVKVYADEPVVAGVGMYDAECSFDLPMPGSTVTKVTR